MFDRVCEIVSGKRLIKENVDRGYNFDTIGDGDGGEKKHGERIGMNVNKPL